MITRPLTKDMLKAMLLRTLLEHTRPNGTLANVARGVDSILHPYMSTLAQFCKLPNLNKDVKSGWSLTEEERLLALQGVEELQRDGFIMDDPNQGSPQFKILTEKGLKYATKDLANLTLPVVDTDAVLSRKELADLVREDYLNGIYDDAIRRAMLKVEEALRAKSRQPAAAFGGSMIRTALAPAAGKLKHPDAQTPAEQDALLNLFLGANGWFRNPTAHRTVGYNDPYEAAQILGLANLLLTLLDKCV
jgi:uncharacterized protein (TIGR02391 family)